MCAACEEGTFLTSRGVCDQCADRVMSAAVLPLGIVAASNVVVAFLAALMHYSQLAMGAAVASTATACVGASLLAATTLKQTGVGPGTVASVSVLIGFIVAVIGTLSFRLLLQRSQTEEDDELGDETKKHKEALQAMGMQKVVAMILNSQLASLFSSNKSVGTSYPGALQQWMERLYSWTEAKVFGIVSFDCLQKMSFLQSALLYLVLPTISFVSLEVWARREGAHGRRTSSRAIRGVLGTVLSLMFITISNRYIRAPRAINKAVDNHCTNHAVPKLARLHAHPDAPRFCPRK